MDCALESQPAYDGCCGGVNRGAVAWAPSRRREGNNGSRQGKSELQQRALGDILTVPQAKVPSGRHSDENEVLR